MVVHIVEDDLAVADALATILGDLEHQPRIYPDGESFLAQADVSEADWLIVDLGLPGVSGADIVLEMKRFFSRLKIVAISGKSHTSIKRQTTGLPHLRVLRKPLSIETLTKAMEHCARDA
ncbi:response regulator [Roseibium aggregatum]|uniref:Response regulator n=1 Tax=Roseibium aggregatum TaxID=187304 RepID=A0A939EAI4_9HYPH|nr:response regulator [Roseibium aggregatum]MBN9669363.1 response regulator [Roseibium aggregatum]